MTKLSVKDCVLTRTEGEEEEWTEAQNQKQEPRTKM